MRLVTYISLNFERINAFLYYIYYTVIPPKDTRSFIIMYVGIKDTFKTKNNNSSSSVMHVYCIFIRIFSDLSCKTFNKTLLFGDGGTKMCMSSKMKRRYFTGRNNKLTQFLYEE